MQMVRLILVMKIYPFDKPTTRQIKYGEYLQSFLRKDEDLSKMTRKELSDYINLIKPDAENVINELQSHTDIVW